MENKRTIIPIASGKGGVGKSIFAANLAIALAQAGHSVVVADLDLGGSNLHTCLGLPNKHPGIGDFLKAGNIRFDDLAVPTSVPNLRFVPGDGRTPFMANITYEQRILLIREIKKISARYVILDLGAGTSFNTLSFYGLAYKGMVVSTFETPSIMNSIMFLRSFLFRLISNMAHGNREALDMLVSSFRQPVRSEPLTVRHLTDRIGEIDPNLAENIRQTCARYRPRIVFNMGDHPDELNMLKKLDDTLQQGLSVKADFFGFIFHDDTVRKSAKRKEVLLTRHPESVASGNIRFVAERVRGIWDRSLENSGIRLMRDTKKQYEVMKNVTAKTRRR